MSSEDSNIKQLELRISLPTKFTAEVDEYRKKMKDMVENYAILSQDENLSEGAIQREALKLFNEFREDQTFDKQDTQLKRQRAKQHDEYYGGTPAEGGFLDQRESTLDQGRSSDRASARDLQRTKSKSIADKALAGGAASGLDVESIMQRGDKVQRGVTAVRGAATGGLAGIVGSVPGLGFLLNNPVTQAAGIALVISQIGQYVVSELKKPGQVHDPRYIFKLVEQAMEERFRSRDTQAALRFGQQNIIATQQQGFQPLDVGLTRNTLQDVVRQGYADIGLRGAGVR